MLKPTLALPLLSILKNHGANAAPTILDLADLPYNEDNRLETHIFAYPAGACAELIDSDSSVWDGHHGHVFVALDGEAYRNVFGHLKGFFSDSPPTTADSFHDCLAVCLEKGTNQSVVARPLPHKYWQYGEKDDEGEMVEVASIGNFFLSDSCAMLEYGFVNYHVNPVKIYWINHQGEPIYNQDLDHGEHSTSFITTFVGHKFQVYDTKPNEDALTNEMLIEVIVPNTGIVGINNHMVPHIPKEDVEEEVRRTLANEWTRHNRVKRTFSPLGFMKGRLPDDMYASLGAYYYNNRNPPNKIHEEWTTAKGVFVNYWETDCK
jgi:hypothetical protein